MSGKHPEEIYAEEWMRQRRGPVEEPGSPRHPVTVETAGSNPAGAATPTGWNARDERHNWPRYSMDDFNYDPEPLFKGEPANYTIKSNRRRRVYLAGPITGYPVSERVATFRNKKAMLERAGFEVVNPCELSPPGLDWNLSLRTDIKAMMDCDTIYLQRGWEKSKGVQLELHIALALGFEVMVEGDDA